MAIQLYILCGQSNVTFWGPPWPKYETYPKQPLKRNNVFYEFTDHNGKHMRHLSKTSYLPMQTFGYALGKEFPSDTIVVWNIARAGAALLDAFEVRIGRQRLGYWHPKAGNKQYEWFGYFRFLWWDPSKPIGQRGFKEQIGMKFGEQPIVSYNLFWSQGETDAVPMGRWPITPANSLFYFEMTKAFFGAFRDRFLSLNNTPTKETLNVYLGNLGHVLWPRPVHSDYGINAVRLAYHIWDWIEDQMAPLGFTFAIVADHYDLPHSYICDPSGKCAKDPYHLNLAGYVEFAQRAALGIINAKRSTKIPPFQIASARAVRAGNLLQSVVVDLTQKADPRSSFSDALSIVYDVDTKQNPPEVLVARGLSADRTRPRTSAPDWRSCEENAQNARFSYVFMGVHQNMNSPGRGVSSEDKYTATAAEWQAKNRSSPADEERRGSGHTHLLG